MLECVVNISEGRDDARIDRLAASAADVLLDVHRDRDHHRSVFTLAGPDAEAEAGVRHLARAVVAEVDLTAHAGAHPRIGALDVVPFVALEGWPVTDGPVATAIGARDRFMSWAGSHLALPCFGYGPAVAEESQDPSRSLPDVRRSAWVTLDPDAGPRAPHPRAGAAAVGARAVLVAYNLWLAHPDLNAARRVARCIRGPDIRALGLAVGREVQVSCNLLHPWSTGPGQAFDAVAHHVPVARAELVGLVPRGVLDASPRHRWPELDLGPPSTIEARLEQAGLDGGSGG